ncbi:MAG: dTMP kinase [Bdellovibrionota bacterium]
MFFLAFEGLDGSGKSSLMNQLQNYLSLNNISFIKTREPGGTDIGDQLRDIILVKKNEVPTPRAELLLYEASRAQHVDLVIKPALQNKKWVLCDRFTASSVAFQAGGRQISEDQVNWLNNFATDALNPDLNILLDLTVEESHKRRQKRLLEIGEVEDRMESEANSFHNRVRESFLIQAKKKQSKWLVLDASKTPENLFDILIRALKDRKWLE